MNNAVQSDYKRENVGQIMLTLADTNESIPRKLIYRYSGTVLRDSHDCLYVLE